MDSNKMKERAVGIAILISLLITSALQAQYSMYRDIKAGNIGDVITVILQENTTGSSTSDSRLSTSSEGSANGAVSGNFLPFQPVFGANSNVEFGSDRLNLASQRQLLRGFISVQIKEVTPSGDLFVEGNRLTEVNGELHEMMLTGIVRPVDINQQNEVMSYKVANANISYMKKGGLKRNKRHRGLLKKVAWTGLTLGLGAAVVMYTNQ